MKNDLTHRVMERVVRYERKHVMFWIVIIAGVALIGFILFVILSLVAVAEISNRQSWDLLTLFYEDPEIIAEYWHDTLYIFWEELPHKTLIGAGFVGVLLLLWWVVTRKRRERIRDKLSGLARYHTN